MMAASRTPSGRASQLSSKATNSPADSARPAGTVSPPTLSTLAAFW
jgi:hypothetical protein